MEPQQALAHTADDDTPPGPFARPRARAVRSALEVPRELQGGPVGKYTLEALVDERMMREYQIYALISCFIYNLFGDFKRYQHPDNRIAATAYLKTDLILFES